ncbi:type II toxin-antitoxin system RelE/ParE family toxin [Herbaspirillum sp. AP02]|uniref:type II toxin-antitoxin system RelE/ParE family toxin n=1 Tax=unclassified Herbaspirillum TaxID=2624150 RepID=UPI0015DBB189|nr:MULTISPECIES: type II toxin-antitoxin system RelE/ParE family toxin [unclassified Herbaspirillum]MBG7619632.1 type II toxin-antitoxin system RelE/ParE family toxin [Herbaspirillum sp. AP02]NZD69533.1 type II toxin-antitoxin system RelE/ParE family toxin [Herbaspirillum sp. AP21]
MALYDVEHYLTTPAQDDLYLGWLVRLRDAQARIAIMRRIGRLEQGNFGDHRFCRDGVWDLRVDIGPGYRVYYGRAGRKLVLLLCGGDKRTQQMDIARAVDCWQDWKRRGTDEKQTP